MIRYLYNIASIVILLVGSQVAADQLSDEAIFVRCYSQMTQQFPSAAHALRASVRSGATDPITACMQVLDSAQFTANSSTRIGNTSNAEAKAVLKSMHRLHASWFKNVDFRITVSEDETEGSRDIDDTTAPAMFITKALFDSNFAYQSALTSNTNLGPLRISSDSSKGQDPTTGAFSDEAKSQYIFGSNTPFAPQGELVGIQATGDMSTNWSNDGNSGTIKLGETSGGGILGTRTYLLLNINERRSFRSNGALEMPRRWGEAVFKDFMCRSLPVVRESDAEPFRDTGGVSFRKATACVRCHASMDRLSAVARNFRYQYISGLGDSNRAPMSYYHNSVSRSAETSWPANSDSVYYQKPPNGVLYFRNYEGTLVDQDVNNYSGLGQAIANQDDYYICAAKRYYEYFTGIVVETGDIADPQYGKTLSSSDQVHRDLVIGLGKNLRSHQNLRQLVFEILSQPHYGLSNYGIEQ